MKDTLSFIKETMDLEYLMDYLLNVKEAHTNRLKELS